MSFQPGENIDGAYRAFVSYIDKSREYYRAQGFENPYRWAHNRDVPFSPLTKPVAECRIGLVTTTTPWDDEHPADLVERGPGRVYARPSAPTPDRMYTMHLSWDKQATHTDDVNSFLPLDRLRELADSGLAGSLSPRFYGVPTEYSQRKTQAVDAPEILALCREDAVEVALLVPL